MPPVSSIERVALTGSKFALAMACALIGAACANPSTEKRSVGQRLPPQPIVGVRGGLASGDDIEPHERECMALNLYWEARGEGREGMQAVAWTVLNRVASPKFPASVCGVVKQGGETPPCQFSWWCDGRSDRPAEPRAWDEALAVSTEMLQHPPPDPTDGALFYHNLTVASPWRKSRQQTTRIGGHVFYR